MRIKLYENFDEEDDLGLINVIGSRATISLSIGTKKDFSDIQKIPEIISDYKKMYVRNNEWSGGPCNREWLEKYHKVFNVSLSTAAHGWKPTVVLNIHTNGFGAIKLGFSIRTKKCCTYDWSEMSKKDTEHPEYYEKSINFLRKYIKKEIFDKGLTFDETIRFLDLELENDFDLDPIESKPGVHIYHKFYSPNLNEEAGTGNNITYRAGKIKDYTQLRKIANQYKGEFGFIKRVAIEESIQKKQLIVAEIDHVVVGFIHFYRRKDGVNTVREIAVDKDHLESGIGKVLYTMVPKPKKLSSSIHNDKINSFTKKVDMNLLKTDKTRQRHLWSTLTESSEEISSDDRELLKGIASKTELLNSLKTLSDRLKEIKDATDTPDKLISYSNFINRKTKLIPSEEDIKSGKKANDIGEIGKDYFYDLLDDGYKHRISGVDYYTTIDFNKIVLKSEGEKEFNKILAYLYDIKHKLVQIEGFNCHFMIWFNNKPQQELNSETHKNDKYSFKGVGDDMKYGEYNKEDYFLSSIKFMII